MTNPASGPERTPATNQAENSGPRVYDTTTPPATTSPNPGRKIGVYDAPDRPAGPNMTMIIVAVVLIAIVAFLLFQFVF